MDRESGDRFIRVKLDCVGLGVKGLWVWLPPLAGQKEGQWAEVTVSRLEE